CRRGCERSTGRCGGEDSHAGGRRQGAPADRRAGQVPDPDGLQDHPGGGWLGRWRQLADQRRWVDEMGTKSRKPRGLYLRGGIWYVRTDPVTGRPLSTGCREDDVAGAEAFVRARRDIAGRPLHAAAETASRDARLIDWIGHLIALRERQ